MDASFVSYCIRRHSGFLSLSVGCQHFLSHSEVSLHYLVFAFLRRGPRYSTNNFLRGAKESFYFFLQASADWETFSFGGFGDGNVGEGCTCCAWVKKVGQEYVPDADFPVGHLSGELSFPTVASRLQVKLLLDPKSPQPMEVL